MKLTNLYKIFQTFQVKEKNTQLMEEGENFSKCVKFYNKTENRYPIITKSSKSDKQKRSRILIFFLFLIILKSFSSSIDSPLKSIFVSSLNVKNLKSNAENNLKLASKGDIPEFCERESVPIVIKSAIGLKVKKSGRETKQNVIQPVQPQPIINNYSIYFYDLLTCLLIIYLILFVLSYLKWFEEMYVVIFDYIYRGYFHFIDLTDIKNIEVLNGKNVKDSKEEIKNEESDGQFDEKNEAKDKDFKKDSQEDSPLSEILIQKLEDQAVYINGKAVIGLSANDSIFRPVLKDYSDVKFMKIERKVEIYDPISKIWEPLIIRGNNKNNFFKESEKFQTNYQRNFSMSQLDENIIRIQFDQGSYLIPKIVCENFNAENVSLRGILLSEVHFNQLQINEIINLNSLTEEELDGMSRVFNMNLENFQSRDRGLNNNDKRSILKRKNQNDDRNNNENIFFDNENMNDIRLVSEIDNEEKRDIKRFPKPAINKDSKSNGNQNNFKNNTKEDENQQEKTSFRLEKSNDFIYISPIEESKNKLQDQYDENQQLNPNNLVDSKNNKCQIRVSFYGYRENQISILAQIKENKFKSVATPYIDDYYKNGLTNNANKVDYPNISCNYSYSQYDIKSQINKNINIADGNEEKNKTNSSIVADMSTNMVLKTNVEMSFLNLFFCCCFNPLPIYIFDKTEALKSFSYTLVNWLYEGKFTKEQFLYKKHKVSSIKLWVNRFIITALIFLILYLFPGLISLTYSIFCNVFFGKTISTEMTRNLFFIVVDLILTFSLVLSIIVYTKLGYNGRFICFVVCSIFIVAFFVMMIIYYLKNRDAIKLEFSIKKS